MFKTFRSIRFGGQRDKSLAKSTNVPYTEQAMNVEKTETYINWFEGLRDLRVQNQIIVRIGRLERGLLGDIRPVGEGISELRIHHGPGYRIYLRQSGDSFVLLLCGGNKDDQARDIKRAKQLAQEIE